MRQETKTNKHMKKFTLFLLSALLTAAAFAQQPQLLKRSKKTRQAVPTVLNKKKASSSVKAEGLITEQPDGVVHDNMYRSSEYYFSDEGYCTASWEDGIIGKIVEGDDGCVYIYNPFTGFPTGTWAKAERGQGDTLIVKGQQPIYAYGNEVDSLDIFDVTETETEDGFYTFEAKYAPIQEAKFIWKDGTLRSADDKVLGISTSSYETAGTWEWAKVGDYHYSFRTINEQVVTLPSGVTFKPYRFLNDRTNAYSDPTVVNVGFKGNDVYLQLDSTIQTGWVRGTIDGNAITFASHQYLGSDNSHRRHLFFMAGTYTKIWNEEWQEYDKEESFADKITFTYNPQTQSFASDSIMFENSGDKMIYYYTKNFDMTYDPFAEIAATPADPIIHMGPCVVELEGCEPFTSYFIDLETPIVDTDSMFINPDKLFYNVFIGNDAAYTFRKAEYPTLPYDFTDVPVYLHDGGLIGMYGRFHMINFADESMFFDSNMNPVVNRVGVQMIYRGGNEEHKSKIVWWNIPLSQVETGIGSISDNGNTVSTTYYDITGRKVLKPAHGIFIKKQLFTDGTVKTCKVSIR